LWEVVTWILWNFTAGICRPSRTIAKVVFVTIVGGLLLSGFPQLQTLALPNETEQPHHHDDPARNTEKEAPERITFGVLCRNTPLP
jgi:hypothetical protein